MKHLMTFCLLFVSITVLCQDRVTSAAYRVRTNATEFTIHFYAFDGVLCTAELNADKLKEPLKFRVEKRLTNSFIMSPVSLIMDPNGTRNRLVVELVGGDVIIKDASNNITIGNAKWFYEGPVNGRGMHCENCLGEDESFGLLRRARALNE
ncbi:hypothetical protein [Spirosoma litoris]